MDNVEDLELKHIYTVILMSTCKFVHTRDLAIV